MNKDVLGKYGYSNIKSLSKTERHSALRDALKKIKPLSVYRRLVALATLNKNKDEELFITLRSDADWIKTQDIYIKSKNIKKVSKKRDSKIKSSKKASKKINWKSVLTFKENIFLVADWYKNFYSNPREVYNLTINQILRYQKILSKKKV